MHAWWVVAIALLAGCSVAVPPAQPPQDDAELSARAAHTATRLPDGRVLVTGGFAAEGLRPLTTSELYDPTTGRWVQAGSLRIGRGGHAAALLGDGRVLVAGGWTGPGTYTATTEIFEPATGASIQGPDLPAAVDGLAAASLADACVLVGGGQRSPGVASAAVVTICPDGSVRPSVLLQARFKHAFVTLPSGRVLAVGGTPNDVGLLGSTEVFDPATGRFQGGPRLPAGTSSPARHSPSPMVGLDQV